MLYRNALHVSLWKSKQHTIRNMQAFLLFRRYSSISPLSMMTQWHGNTFFITNPLLRYSSISPLSMMTLWHGNTFFITNPLLRESTSGFPSQRASNVELWCVSSVYQLEQTVQQTLKWSINWDAMTLAWHHCDVIEWEWSNSEDYW